MRTRKEWLWLMAIVVVVLVWFSPWWGGGRVLAPLDVLNEMLEPWRDDHIEPEVKNHMVVDSVTQYLGYRLFAEEQLRTEGRIGWSDLTYGGTPSYANTMALFDDWSVQLHRWLPFWTAWHLGLMGQVLIAAIGMWFFLRGRQLDSIWCLVGAIAWAANSQFICWINHRWALSAFCWLPWAYLAMDHYRSGKRAWGFVVPVVMAMGFLGGTLQHSGIWVLAVGAYWLSESRGFALRSRLLSGLRHLGWGVLACAFAGFMLLPNVEAFRISSALELHTGMFEGREQGLYPEGIMQPVLNAMAYPLQVFPSLVGSCDSVDLLKLFKSELFYIAYFGSLPVILAWLCFFRKESPILGKWLIGMGLLLPLSPMVRWLYQRLYLLFIFGGILVFAHFMQHASRETKLRTCRWISTVGGVAVLVWFAGSVFFQAAGQSWLDGMAETIRERGASSTFGYFDGWMALRSERLIERIFIWSPWQVLPLAAFAVGLLGFRLTASEQQKLKEYGQWLLLFAVFAEVTLFAQRWVSWSDPDRQPLYAETPLHRELAERVGADGRVKNVIHPATHMPKTPAMQNTLVPYGIPTINGYDSIVPDGMTLPTDPNLEARRLAQMGVSHLVAPSEVSVLDPGWRQVWADASSRVYENAIPSPRYMGLSEVGLNEFRSNEWPCEGHVLSEQLGLQNRRMLEVPAEVGWVRIAENHVEGWRWRVDGGEWKKVRRAFDGSMLIALDVEAAGSPQVVEMSFDPASRRLGVYMSVASLVVWGLFLIRYCVRVLPRIKTEADASSLQQ